MKTFIGVCIVIFAVQTGFASPHRPGGGRRPGGRPHESGHGGHGGPGGEKVPAYLQAPANAIRQAIDSLSRAIKLGSPNLVTCENLYAAPFITTITNDYANTASACLPAQSGNVTALNTELQKAIPLLQAGNNAGLAVQMDNSRDTLKTLVQPIIAAVKGENAANSTTFQACIAPFSNQIVVDADAFTASFNNCILTGA